MLTAVLRDAAVVPAPVKEARLAREREWREQMIRTLPRQRRKTVRAAVGHAISFGTGRSLCVDLGLSNASAIDLMVAMTAAAVNDAAPVCGRSARRSSASRKHAVRRPDRDAQQA